MFPQVPMCEHLLPNWSCSFGRLRELWTENLAGRSNSLGVGLEGYICFQLCACFLSLSVPM